MKSRLIKFVLMAALIGCIISSAHSAPIFLRKYSADYGIFRAEVAECSYTLILGADPNEPVNCQLWVGPTHFVSDLSFDTWTRIFDAFPYVAALVLGLLAGYTSFIITRKLRDRTTPSTQVP